MRARAYFNKGQWDDALKEYRAVLRNNLESSEAADGISMISRAYAVRGDKAFNQQNWGTALLYYKKASRLNPDDLVLQRAFERAEKSLHQSQLDKVTKAAAPQELAYRSTNSVLNSEKLTVTGFATKKWDFTGLDSKSDYQINAAKLLFNDNIRIKKAFLNRTDNGSEVETLARRISGSRNGKYGIIFGLQQSNSVDNRYFYLFTLDSNGNYALQRVSRFSVKILVANQMEAGIMANFNQIQLKVKTEGRSVSLFANGALLKNINLDEEISGGVGLYADPRLSVEFSRFKLVPSIN